MLLWRCHHQTRSECQLPYGFLSISPAFRNDDLPLESIALLPGGDGTNELLQQLILWPERTEGAGVALFLSDPFLNIKQVSSQLKNLGIDWISNIPSIAQHDEDFCNELADVDISIGRELKVLHEFRKQGFQTMATVSSKEHAITLADCPADAILVVQTTADLQISFPSLPQRLKKVRQIAELEGAANCSVLPVVTESDLPQIDYPCVLRPIWFDDYR